MLMEVVGNDLYFQMISDKGETIDAGSVHRVGKLEPTRGIRSQPVQRVSRRRSSRRQNSFWGLGTRGWGLETPLCSS